jgi:hypothetical protein
MPMHEDLKWIEPRTIEEAEQVIALVSQEYINILGQISARKAEVVGRHLPDDEWREYNAWRVKVLRAKAAKEQLIIRLRAWVKNQRGERRQVAAEITIPNIKTQIRRAKYLLHRVVEEGGVSQELTFAILTFLQDTPSDDPS